MKKYFIMLMFMLILPLSLFAEEKEDSIVPLNLEETLKLDKIEIDLSNYKESDEKVNVYLFWGKGCSHCKAFLSFVSSELVKNYSEYFNFTSFEVWSNPGNSNLMDKVADAMNAEDATGVPFIIIGEEYFVGYGERLNSTIINVIKNEASKSSKKDIVRNVINGEDEPASNEIDEEEKDDKNDEKTVKNENSYSRGKVEDNDWLIKVVLVIVGVTLGGVVVILCNLRKKSVNSKKGNRKS